MPTPRKKEKRKEFIQRCILFPDMQKFPIDERIARCHGIWRQHQKDKRKSDNKNK